ncbi:MAG TPA: glycosyltransferase [Longimicrobiales bacterium]|jgi:glycosyltransferase involved in cell wall biosynthesis
MRIWVISSSYPRHPEESVNAGVIARDLALSLAEQGHEITVVTPRKPGGTEFDPVLSGIELPWLSPTLSLADLSPKRPADLLRMVSLFLAARPRLRRAVRRAPPEATIALWALPSGILARWVHRMAGAPYAVWVLGSDVWKAPRFPGGSRILTTVLRDAEAAFADGTALAEEAERLTGVRVAFLPSCRRLPPPPEHLPEATDVLFVGRYHPNKGPDVLIESAALLRAARPDVQVRMYGQGEMRPMLERTVMRLGLEGSIQVSGPLSATALSGAMARAKVLAIPSRIESIPLILGDAVQAGLPVVCSAVGDLPSVVDRYGLGTTVPPGRPDALAAALDRSLADPKRLPPEAGPPWLSPDGLATEMLKVFTS